MACEGCRRRREAIRRAAETFTNSVKAALNRPASKAEQSPKSVLPCSGCLARVTAAGWVNVCRHCNSQSDPTPSPSNNPPKCPATCPRLSNE